jgi:hypothetical protein
MAGQQNIPAMDRPPPGGRAETFLKVLRLIHRSVLPRRIVLSNGEARLMLQAERARAVLDGAPADGSPADMSGRVAAAIGQFCAAGGQVTHRVERASQVPVGYSPIAIVNAQSTSSGASDAGRQYRFADDGWPLGTPADASFASLEAATRIAWAMLRWRRASGGLLQAPALIVATAEGLPEDVSVTVGDGLAITVTRAARLGQAVSRWRNQAGDEEKSE